MSHTTEIKSVPIRDIQAVQQTVRELIAEGCNITLVENESPRMYYANQHGTCEYVIRLNDAPYDVGLKKQDDGSYALVLDTWAGHVGRVLGARGEVEAEPSLKAVGRFLQGYAKNVAISTAQRQGYQVRGAQIDQNGNVQLSINVR